MTCRRRNRRGRGDGASTSRRTPTGLEDETVEPDRSSCERGPRRRRGRRPRDVDEIVLERRTGFSGAQVSAHWCFRRRRTCALNLPSRVENAVGSAAGHQGLKAIAAGAARIVLVVGAEQDDDLTQLAEIGRNLLKASYVREEADIDGGFAGIFADRALLPALGRSIGIRASARIAAKNRKNGVANPYAQIRKDLGYEVLHRARRIRAWRGRSSLLELLARLRQHRRRGTLNIGNSAAAFNRRSPSAPPSTCGIICQSKRDVAKQAASLDSRLGDAGHRLQ